MAEKKQIKTEKEQETLVKVYCKLAYYDKKLGRNVYFGETVEVTEDRAELLVSKGFVLRV